jgi:hypothetical protein
MARSHTAVYVAVLVAAGAAVGAPAAAGDRAPKLDLVWVDPTRMAPGTFGAMKAESAFVLGELGADVTWTQAPDGAVLGPESMAVIAVPTHHSAGNEARHVMGATRPDTSLPPAIWVYPDEVAWALGLDVRARASWGSSERMAFALALARVVSHEVVHALGVPSHAAHGLMAASLDRRALTTPTIVIDTATLAAVKRTLGGALVAGLPALPRRAAPAADLPEGVIARRDPGR